MRIVTVVVGTPEVITSEGSVSLDSIPTPAVIAALPGGGGTLLVEYQIVEGGSWTEWPGSAVATKTIYVLTGPVYALRFTAAVADGTVEITA